MGSSWRPWLLAGIFIGCGGGRFESGPSVPGEGGGEAGTGQSEGGRGGTGTSVGGEPSTDEHGGSPSAGAGGEAPAAQGGEGGEGASPPDCDDSCGEDHECQATSAGAECRCRDGLVAEGDGCRLPRSCNELHLYAPSLPSGPFELKPVGVEESFKTQCGMMQEGGGWTLAVNEGPSFDPTVKGVTDSVCYATSCVNLAYSLVPLEQDVMLDVSNSPIVSTTYSTRLVITGVHEKSRGKTLRTLFTTGPNFVEAENNANLAVRLRDGGKCEDLPIDLAKIVCRKCDTPSCPGPVLVFGDGDSAEDCGPGPEPRLAIGASSSYAAPWTNCAGWPQAPNFSDKDYYPDYVRVWVR